MTNWAEDKRDESVNIYRLIDDEENTKVIVSKDLEMSSPISFYQSKRNEDDERDRQHITLSIRELQDLLEKMWYRVTRAKVDTFI